MKTGILAHTAHREQGAGQQGAGESDEMNPKWKEKNKGRKCKGGQEETDNIQRHFSQ